MKNWVSPSGRNMETEQYRCNPTWKNNQPFHIVHPALSDRIVNQKFIYKRKSCIEFRFRLGFFFFLFWYSVRTLSTIGCSRCTRCCGRRRRMYTEKCISIVIGIDLCLDLHFVKLWIDFTWSIHVFCEYCHVHFENGAYLFDTFICIWIWKRWVELWWRSDRWVYSSHMMFFMGWIIQTLFFR